MNYRTSDVLKIFSINRNTFQDWLDRQFIVPSISRSTKQGDPNLFSLSDLYCIYLFQQLMNFGINRKNASEYSKIMVNYEEKKIDDIQYLFINTNIGSNNYYMPEISLLVHPPNVDFFLQKEFSLLINLKVLIERVHELIKEK